VLAALLSLRHGGTEQVRERAAAEAEAEAERAEPGRAERALQN
jgi:hypothetical protein